MVDFYMNIRLKQIIVTWANKSIVRALLVALILVSSIVNVYASDKQQCLDKIQRQGQIILVVNRKATAMPPLTSVYVYTNDLWRKAISEKDQGNFRECNRILDISINYSEPYAR